MLLDRQSVRLEVVEVTIPQLGLTMEEAELISWRVAVGDSVNEGDILGEIATDKIDHELPSPVSGAVEELVAAPGQVLAVGEVIARIRAD